MDDNSTLLEIKNNLTCDTYVPSFTENINGKLTALLVSNIYYITLNTHISKTFPFFRFAYWSALDDNRNNRIKYTNVDCISKKTNMDIEKHS